jgi:subtilisin family serine protease
VLDDPSSLRAVEDLEVLADETADDPGVRIAAVIDRNGSSPGGISVEAVRVPGEHAEQVRSAIAAVDDVVVAGVDSRVEIAASPNAPDPYQFDLWSLSKTRAKALPATANGAGTTVAVVDTGVDHRHPDLAGRLADGRLRVARGATFLSGDGSPDRRHADRDVNGHGTHVAGIISAAANNGVGVRGHAPQAQILPVRVLDDDGGGWGADVAAGVLWAHQQGADVMNLSFVGGGRNDPLMVAIRTAVLDTSRGKPGSVVVAAAGNHGLSLPTYPAADETVISVGWSEPGDGRSQHSNHGSWLDLLAPGEEIMSTVPGGYASMSGTSMAAPVVASAAAILRQQDPSRSPAEVRTRLIDTAHDLRDVGFDTSTGWGRVDLAAAYDASRFPVVPRTTSNVTAADIRVLEARGRGIKLFAVAIDHDGPAKIRVESILDGRRRSVRTFPVENNGVSTYWNDLPGTHRVCVTAIDHPSGFEHWGGCEDVIVK